VLGLAVVWALVARVLHKASLASLLCVILFPVAALAMGYDGREVIALSALAVLVLARHAANIRRLLRREEIDLSQRDRGTDRDPSKSS
jgi:glycerol-3-phosphate acyltransferase PlsY